MELVRVNFSAEKDDEVVLRSFFCEDETLLKKTEDEFWREANKRQSESNAHFYSVRRVTKVKK